MAMIYSSTPCVAAGTFTTNQVKAAPVIWDRDTIYTSDYVHAVVCNSGVANACTGKIGMDYCEQMAEATAKALDIEKRQVLVASTGVIGAQLPMDKITKGIQLLAPTLDESLDGGHLAAEDIITTDTIPKKIAFEFEIGGKTCTIGGMCKGSGMIHPNMCTMLGFIMTDVKISKSMLYEALSGDIKDTFNMISVDGDTSTNDTVLLLANGLAVNPEITEKNEDYYKFVEALHAVNEFLAKKIAGDGEGATALFEVKIVNAESKEQAAEYAADSAAEVQTDETETAENRTAADKSREQIEPQTAQTGEQAEPQTTQTGEQAVSEAEPQAQVQPRAVVAVNQWIRDGNRWWYRHADGSYTTNGWEVINGAWYYFDGAGWMVTGWVKLSGTWYYLTGSGAMTTGWIQTGGTWYYMNTSGAMVTDTWIGNNYVDGSGAWIPGKVKAQAGWVQSGSPGQAAFGW